ncbi:MAG: FAD-dependent oxidoreductase [Actinobacteria bacterium]|nr:FAD-dependent oxidoreductase [Actinomycetota bacterium]
MAQREMNRRSFLKGSLLAGSAVATSALVGCGAAPAQESSAAESAAALHTWEVAPEPIADGDIVETFDADIVIVGSGAAGIFAAQSAAEEGAKVIIIEQSGSWQGRGLDIGSIGNAFQKENGYDKYINAREAEEIFYQWAHCKVNRNLFRFWADNSGAVFDYYAEYLKTNFDMVPYMSSTAIPSHYDADVNFRELPTCQSYGQGWFDADGNWLMVGVLNKIATWAQELGADFRFNTKAEQLIREENGPVTGVIASTDAGYVKFNAAKAVILATGDIGGNQEMLAAWCPMCLDVDANAYTPANGNLGDGVKMAMWIGADVQKGPAAPMVHPLPIKSGPLSQNGDLGFLCVNRNGERYSNEFNNTPGICNARLNQPGNIAYTIYDGDYKNKALKQVPGNVSLSGLPIVDDTTAQTIEAAVAANDGTLFRADTIEELATLIGAEPDALVATVARYNELVAQGEDVDMMTPSNWLSGIETPPYYASYIAATTLVCIYGLNCDSQSRVCDTDDTPIENLYAIGNVQGNFFAADYPLIAPGVSHGRCMTFGNLLPKAILKGELI